MFSEVSCYLAMRYIYQSSELERFMLKLNPARTKFDKDLIKKCLAFIEAYEKGVVMRWSDSSFQKFVLSFTRKNVQTEIGRYIANKDNGYKITIDFVVYQQNYEDILVDFAKGGRKLFYGTTPIEVCLPFGGEIAKLKFNGSLHLVPVSACQLFGQFSALNSSQLELKRIVSDSHCDDKSSQKCLKAIYKTADDGTEKSFLFSIYASHVKSNADSSDVICLIDDRKYEVCSKNQMKMNVKSILDFADVQKISY